MSTSLFYVIRNVGLTCLKAGDVGEGSTLCPLCPRLQVSQLQLQEYVRFQEEEAGQVSTRKYYSYYTLYTIYNTLVRRPHPGGC